MRIPVTIDPHSPGARKAYIDSYIWCGLGAAFGWLLSMFMGGASRIVMIENILVGMFGAYVGAEFIPAMLRAHAAPEQGFVVKLGFSILGSVGLLLLLRLMRSSVGPMKNSTSKKRKDY